VRWLLHPCLNQILLSTDDIFISKNFVVPCQALNWAGLVFLQNTFVMNKQQMGNAILQKNISETEEAIVGIGI
jgi:hypothetical protein